MTREQQIQNIVSKEMKGFWHCGIYRLNQYLFHKKWWLWVCIFVPTVITMIVLDQRNLDYMDGFWYVLLPAMILVFIGAIDYLNIRRQLREIHNKTFHELTEAVDSDEIFAFDIATMQEFRKALSDLGYKWTNY